MKLECGKVLANHLAPVTNESKAALQHTYSIIRTREAYYY